MKTKNSRKHTSQESKDDEGWLSKGKGIENKPKRLAGNGNGNGNGGNGHGHPSKGVSGAGLRSDSPPELDSYRSQYSPEEASSSKQRTFKPLPSSSASSTGGAFKVPLKVNTSSSSSAGTGTGTAAAAAVYGEKEKKSLQSSNDARTKARVASLVNMVTGSGKTVSLSTASKKMTKPDRWSVSNSVDTDEEEEDGRAGRDQSTNRMGSHAQKQKSPTKWAGFDVQRDRLLTRWISGRGQECW